MDRPDTRTDSDDDAPGAAARIAELVNEAREASDGRWETVVGEAWKVVQTDRALLLHVGQVGLESIVRRIDADLRTKLVRAGHDALRGRPQTPADGVLDAIRAGSASYYDWPLQGGLTLGDSRRPQVQAAIHDYKGKTTTSMARMRWLQAVHEELGNDENVVREAIGLSRLQVLMAKAEHTAAVAMERLEKTKLLGS